MKRKVQQPVAAQGELVKYDQQGMPQLEVWLEDETIWLTQKQMAELFGCSSENVILHLKNIYAEDELTEAATAKDFLVVRIEGKRRVSRRIKYYNLDAIISVGYRVNSKRGVKFRQWATAVLKEYLLRGLVRDQQFCSSGQLQRFAVTEKDALLRSAACANHDRHRRRQSQRAGTGHHQYGYRFSERISKRRSKAKPDYKHDRAYCHHYRYEYAGDLVRKSAYGRFGRARLFDHSYDAAERSIIARFRDPQAEKAVCRDRRR